MRVWRDNTRGVYHIIDFRTGKMVPLSRGKGLQMFAKLSPDGSQAAFVRDNNLWLSDVAAGTEKDPNLCVPGKDETAKVIKDLLKGTGLPAAAG